MEEIAAERRPQLADVNMESIGHVNWVDEDPDHFFFVRVIEEGVQVKLLGEVNQMSTDDKPP